MDLSSRSSLDRRRRGLLIVLSSPSGAGKSTISRMLLKADPEVTMSISATTRPKRPGERDDVDYHFVADAEFDRLIAAGFTGVVDDGSNPDETSAALVSINSFE